MSVTTTGRTESSRPSEGVLFGTPCMLDTQESQKHAKMQTIMAQSNFTSHAPSHSLSGFQVWVKSSFLIDLQYWRTSYGTNWQAQYFGPAINCPLFGHGLSNYYIGKWPIKVLSGSRPNRGLFTVDPIRHLVSLLKSFFFYQRHNALWFVAVQYFESTVMSDLGAISGLPVSFFGMVYDLSVLDFLRYPETKPARLLIKILHCKGSIINPPQILHPAPLIS